MITLAGKHVLIIGGSRGIGAGAATCAAELGSAVSLTYRFDQAAAKSVVAAIEAQGGKAAAFQADMAQEDETEAAVAAAVEKFGPPFGLVVSAGIGGYQPLAEATLEHWNRIISTNLTGTFLAVKAAAPYMRAAGAGGSIVIYSSTAGQSGGGGGIAAYAVSKGGQILFMKCMAHELGPDQIRVNCIAPGWTETDMAAASLDAMGRENVAKGFPLGRIGQVKDVADATCFLLSDMAQFITGTTVTVDGGLGMRG